ncbi:YciI family protein [Paenibacillus chartarius]|uniref:YciI family protein n=1 Tax=Paenibacillus chartarius TaxID=747481 RepID=A0ABV6DNK2_9BACL
MIHAAFLTIIDQEKNMAHRPAHLEYLSRLFDQGKVIMAGPFTDGKGGLVLYKTETVEEARELAEQDPVVLHGARTLELREWKPLQFPIELA